MWAAACARCASDTWLIGISTIRNHLGPLANVFLTTDLFGPQRANFRWKATEQLLRLAWIETLDEDPERRECGFRGVERRVSRQVGVDVVEIVLRMPLVCRIGQAPSFVVRPAEKHRKLSSEMNGILGSDTIAQRVKTCAQRGKSAPAIIRIELLHHELQPMIGFLQRRIEHLEARFAHRPLSCVMPRTVAPKNKR